MPSSLTNKLSPTFRKSSTCRRRSCISVLQPGTLSRRCQLITRGRRSTGRSTISLLWIFWGTHKTGWRKVPAKPQWTSWPCCHHQCMGNHRWTRWRPHGRWGRAARAWAQITNRVFRRKVGKSSQDVCGWLKHKYMLRHTNKAAMDNKRHRKITELFQINPTIRD